MPSPCPQQALFSEDFYFKYGLRPTPAEVLQSPFLPPLADLPFSPVQRRYTGYQKYAPRVVAGVEAYAGELREAVAEGQWGAVASLLEKGSKGRGSNTKGEGTGKPAAPLRASCRAFGLFANTVLQSENDGGTTTANLLARHLINELYFSMDDMAEAAAAADQRLPQVTKACSCGWVGMDGSVVFHKPPSVSILESLFQRGFNEQPSPHAFASSLYVPPPPPQVWLPPVLTRWHAVGMLSQWPGACVPPSPL
eukprot:scaffold7583_cov118-Isochrysis_galbana.AAC.7